MAKQTETTGSETGPFNAWVVRLTVLLKERSVVCRLTEKELEALYLIGVSPETPVTWL